MRWKKATALTNTSFSSSTVYGVTPVAIWWTKKLFHAPSSPPPVQAKTVSYGFEINFVGAPLAYRRNFVSLRFAATVQLIRLPHAVAKSDALLLLLHCSHPAQTLRPHWTVLLIAFYFLVACKSFTQYF